MRERMLRGELYIGQDPDNAAEFLRVQDLLAQFKGSAPGASAQREALLRQTLRHVDEGVVIRPPFFCEYGAISIGDRTFVNVDAVMLDVALITIGAACQIATRVQLLTAAHPIDPQLRRAGWEYGQPITLADNVWLGGGVSVCPGVTIGQDAVVGTGAVVTQDLLASWRLGYLPASCGRSEIETGSRSPLARSSEFVTRLWPPTSTSTSPTGSASSTGTP